MSGQRKKIRRMSLDTTNTPPLEPQPSPHSSQSSPQVEQSLPPHPLGLVIPRTQAVSPDVNNMIQMREQLQSPMSQLSESAHSLRLSTSPQPFGKARSKNGRRVIPRSYSDARQYPFSRHPTQNSPPTKQKGLVIDAKQKKQPVSLPSYHGVHSIGGQKVSPVLRRMRFPSNESDEGSGSGISPPTVQNFQRSPRRSPDTWPPSRSPIGRSTSDGIFDVSPIRMQMSSADVYNRTISPAFQPAMSPIGNMSFVHTSLSHTAIPETQAHTPTLLTRTFREDGAPSPMPFEAMPRRSTNLSRSNTTGGSRKRPSSAMEKEARDAREMRSESAHPWQNDDSDDDFLPEERKYKRRRAQTPAPDMRMDDDNERATSAVQCKLPILRHKAPHMYISTETVAHLIDPENPMYQDAFDEVWIFDCRFDYEYEGGHIQGAVNENNCERLLRQLFEGKTSADDDQQRICVIFHCEFSQVRGPKTADTMRKHDRQLHGWEGFLHLYYPDLYIMSGGYKEFFAKFPHLCTPEAYVRMDHPDHTESKTQMMREWQTRSNPRRQNRMRRSHSLGSLSSRSTAVRDSMRALQSSSTVPTQPTSFQGQRTMRQGLIAPSAVRSRAQVAVPTASTSLVRSHSVQVTSHSRLNFEPQDQEAETTPPTSSIFGTLHRDFPRTSQNSPDAKSESPLHQLPSPAAQIENDEKRSVSFSRSLSMTSSSSSMDVSLSPMESAHFVPISQDLNDSQDRASTLDVSGSSSVNVSSASDYSFSLSQESLLSSQESNFSQFKQDEPMTLSQALSQTIREQADPRESHL